MVAKGFIGDGIQLARLHVSLDLAIPCSCIKLGEPPPKLCKFLSRETADSLLEGFEFTHTRTIPPSSFAGYRLSHEQPHTRISVTIRSVGVSFCKVIRGTPK